MRDLVDERVVDRISKHQRGPLVKPANSRAVDHLVICGRRVFVRLVEPSRRQWRRIYGVRSIMQNPGAVDYDAREREPIVAKIRNLDELAGGAEARSGRVTHGNAELKSPGLFHRQIKAIDDSIAHGPI